MFAIKFFVPVNGLSIRLPSFTEMFKYKLNNRYVKMCILFQIHLFFTFHLEDITLDTVNNARTRTGITRTHYIRFEYDYNVMIIIIFQSNTMPVFPLKS